MRDGQQPRFGEGGLVLSPVEPDPLKSPRYLPSSRPTPQARAVFDPQRRSPFGHQARAVFGPQRRSPFGHPSGGCEAWRSPARSSACTDSFSHTSKPLVLPKPCDLAEPRISPEPRILQVRASSKSVRPSKTPLPSQVLLARVLLPRAPLPRAPLPSRSPNSPRLGMLLARPRELGPRPLEFQPRRKC